MHDTGRAIRSQNGATFTAADVVQALYHAVLNRDPDASGLATYADLLQSGESSLGEIAAAFHSSEEHRRIMLQPRGIDDHSQHGEMPKLLRLLLRRSGAHGIIVDVGARGRERSNSYDLLREFGWRGLLVEANPALLDSIRREFDGLTFELVGCAIAPENGTLPFYIGVNDDVSSLIEGAAQGWGAVREVVNVEARRLHEILLEHRIPFDFDVLSVDIEGVDIPVLNDLVASSAYRPAIIIVEVVHTGHDTDPAAIGMSEAFRSAYEIVDHTVSNLILQRRF